MKHKIYLFIGLLVLTLSFGSFERVLACSCFKTPSVCEAFGNAKAVFVGEVVEGKSIETMSERLANGSNDLTFTFKIARNYLGAEEENITLHTGFGFGDCGFPFQKGESYLVYAYEFGGKLSTNICTRTRPVSRVEGDFEDLQYLSLKKSAEIYGTVINYAKHSSENDAEQPMANLKLEIRQIDGEKKKFEVITDDEGKYKLFGLTTGKYKIVPLLPNGLKIEDYQTNEFLLNDKGCANKDFYVKNDSRISGKVIDADGNPAFVKVEVIPPNITSKPNHISEFTYAMSGGNFTFYNIPPGKYLIAANYTNQPSEQSPFATSFYKTKGEKSVSTIIEVGLGQTIEDLVIQLSPPLPMLEIRGRVFWKNGKPAKGISVNLRDAEAKQNISDAETDSRGNFVIRGFAGRKYILETYYFENGLEDKYEAKDVEFVLDQKTGAFKLVLEKKIEEQ